MPLAVASAKTLIVNNKLLVKTAMTTQITRAAYLLRLTKRALQSSSAKKWTRILVSRAEALSCPTTKSTQWSNLQMSHLYLPRCLKLALKSRAIAWCIIIITNSSNNGSTNRSNNTLIASSLALKRERAILSKLSWARSRKIYFHRRNITDLLQNITTIGPRKARKVHLRLLISCSVRKLRNEKKRRE